MIAFVIGIIVTIVAFIVLGIDFDEVDFMWGPKKRQVFSLIGLIICLIGFIKTVPTGSTGIVTTFGRIENITLDAGIHFIHLEESSEHGQPDTETVHRDAVL